ncbi:MAG: class I SAM-dependent methyltransferase [Bacteroidales bacterium]|jgi:2-polyprenyl-3-methyl-5-hydroxy-6-metoxy-1,4-benzoquinol methylase|nr:class I SAM-dependent methyltransferase [Bacteroidales bacterium]
MDIKELNVPGHSNNKQNHPWEYARSKVVNNIIKKYIRNIDNGVALDIGSGDVFFLTQFSNSYPGFKLIAVDTAYDDKLISSLTEKYKSYNITFYKDLKEIHIPHSKPASVVFLLDVIEHIENDVGFLKSLSTNDYINQDTVFMITVPAYQSLYCEHDKWLGHYRRYSQHSLERCIKNAGLTYIAGGYFFSSLLFPRLIQKVHQNFTSENKNVKGVGDWNGKKALSYIFEKILLLDYFFSRILKSLRINIPGLSTYILCRKIS